MPAPVARPGRKEIAMEAQAYDLGKQAFEAGIRIPFYDERLTALLAGHEGEKTPLLAAWYRGWTAAQISQPPIACRSNADQKL